MRPFAAGMSVALFSLGAFILFLTLRTPTLQARIDPLAIYAFCVVAFWFGSVVAMLVRPPTLAHAAWVIAPPQSLSCSELDDVTLTRIRR